MKLTFITTGSLLIAGRLCLLIFLPAGAQGAETFAPSPKGYSSGQHLWLRDGVPSDLATPEPGRPTTLRQTKDLNIGSVTGYVVRVAYVIPTNRVAQSNGVASLRNSLIQYQNWYRDQMQMNGFGAKTFRFETEADNTTPKVYTVNVVETDSYLRGDLWGRTISAASTAGVPVWTSKQVWWLIPEAHLEMADGSITGGAALGGSVGSGDDPGVAMVGSDALVRFKPGYLTNDAAYHNQSVSAFGPYPLQQDVSFPWFEGTTFSSISSSVLGGGLHETSHAFGLAHDFRNDQNFNGNLMGNGVRGIRGTFYPNRYASDYTRASYASALVLAVSRFFNTNLTYADNTKPTLAISTTGTNTAVNGLIRINFTASDTSGLHAALLLLNGDVVGEMKLSGTSASQTFATPYYTPGQTNQFSIAVFDVQGNKQSADTFIVPRTGFNQAPQPFVKVSSPTILVGQGAVFDASASTDPDGSASSLLVEWDLNGDGVFDTSPTTSKIITNVFTSSGDRLIQARLTDPSSAQSVSTPIAVRVSLPGMFPADIRPTDSMIEIDEATGYVAAWRSGSAWAVAPNPIPMDYAVRASYLWLADAFGTYVFTGSLTNAPLCWVSPNAPKPPGSERKDLSGSTALSSMTNRYATTVPITVMLTITPATNVLAWGVEEQVPIGWAVTNVSDAGLFHPETGLVQWGVFYGAIPRPLTYQITPPSNATGMATFSGKASFDGASQPISGVRQLLPAAFTSLLTTPIFSSQFGFQLQLVGSVGGLYILQASTNLKSWISLQTNVNNSGTLQILDPTATNFTHRFYRAISEGVAGPIFISATSGAVAAPFIITNGYIYQTIQTTVVTNGGRAAYDFTIAVAGTYVVQAVVNAPGDAANSFFANVDAEPQSPTMIWDMAITSGFEQRTISWRGNGTDTANQFVPKAFSLSQGPHQLIIRGREANTQLQSVTILAINFTPAVAAINQSPADVDPSVGGVQAYAGATAQYSGSAADPNGNPLTWQWIYQVNGGAEVVYQSGSGTVPTISFTYGSGAAGSNYLWTLRASNGQVTSQSQLAVGVEAPPVPPGGLTIPAPQGIITAPFIITNGYVYQSIQTTTVTNGGRAVYNFTITNAGNYVIQTVVNAPNDGANSIFLNVDNEPQDPFMISDISPFTSGFQQRTLSWRGNGTFDANQFVPKIFTLSTGPHQLVIRGREAAVLLQSITVAHYP